MKFYPLITIGITCFNAEDTICRAIESSLAQTWPNLEIVIVDDCSFDKSFELISGYSLKYNNIRSTRHDINQGCAVSRNTIIELAQGEYIAFFDDDDASRDDRILLQYNRIIEYEKCVRTNLIACFASGYRYYQNGYAKPINAVGSLGVPPSGKLMIDYLLLYKKNSDVFYGAGTPTCSMMAKTSIFRLLGGFDPELRRQEDADFAIRLASIGGHFIGISDPVLSQYVTDGTEKSAYYEYISFIRLLCKNKCYLQESNNYRFMNLWAKMRYFHFSKQDAKALFILIQLQFLFPLRTFFRFTITSFRRFCHERRILS